MTKPQVAGLSRGSSAESSLKRTKRKAPLPPTTSSASDQETVPVKENSQGSSVQMCTFHFVMSYVLRDPRELSKADSFYFESSAP